jgi:hypothetical protein
MFVSLFHELDRRRAVSILQIQDIEPDAVHNDPRVGISQPRIGIGIRHLGQTPIHDFQAGRTVTGCGQTQDQSGKQDKNRPVIHDFPEDPMDY